MWTLEQLGGTNQSWGDKEFSQQPQTQHVLVDLQPAGMVQLP